MKSTAHLADLNDYVEEGIKMHPTRLKLAVSRISWL
jgi:hypothetical protein